MLSLLLAGLLLETKGDQMLRIGFQYGFAYGFIAGIAVLLVGIEMYKSEIRRKEK